MFNPRTGAEQISAARLAYLVGRLPEGATLDCAATGNLMVRIDGCYVGFVDFANERLCVHRTQPEGGET